MMRRTTWHSRDRSQIEQGLATGSHGLGRAEVEARLARYGANLLDEAAPPSVLTILLHQFQSPLIYILLVATVVTLALEEYIDAGVIAAVLGLNAIIGFIQEYRAEHSVRALMQLVSPKARVIRAGREQEIESRDLVAGDLVLESGARVPADIALADDNFVSIYAAVEEGRITFDNLRKVTFFLLSTGAAVLVSIPAAIMMGWPLPFLPAQLLWLNLVTNGLQDVALAFEPGERDVLKRPLRPPVEGVISRLLWERTIVAGLVMAVGTLSMFWWEWQSTDNIARAQTVALTPMVLFQMFHVGNCRSESRSIFLVDPLSNPFVFLATAAAFVIHAGALYWPPTQFILRVEPIELEAWVRIVLVAATIIVAMELHKLLRRRAGPSVTLAYRSSEPRS